MTRLAFSPDGRLLAVGYQNGTVSVREAIAGRQLALFTSAQNAIESLRFSPDGQHLASGGQDSTILIWDVAEPSKATRRQEHKLEGAKLAGLWRDLADTDAGNAYIAIDQLAAASDAAVAYIKATFKLPRPVDDRAMARLISDLDNDDFETRQDACISLEEIGEAAIAALQKAIANKPSLELATRCDQLLKRLKSGLVPRGGHRSLRAIEVLELIGTKDAVALLETYAKHDKTLPLCQEATFALERLAKKRVRNKK
jgi:hypothetical protein